MKHIKNFKIFESKFENLSHEEMTEMYMTCKDILLELEDLGFRTNTTFFYNPWITFRISNNKHFEYDEIKEVVDRLSDYLSEFGFQIEWQSPSILNALLSNTLNFETTRGEYIIIYNF